MQDETKQSNQQPEAGAVKYTGVRQAFKDSYATTKRSVVEAKRISQPKDPKHPKTANSGVGARQFPGRTLLIWLVVAALVSSLAGLGLSIYVATRLGNLSVFPPVQDGNSMQFSETSIDAVVERVAPSVVSIVTTTQTTGSGSIFDLWFGGGGGSTQQGQASGTGMIVTADGYVLTNKHVIENATNVTVVMSDGALHENVKVVAEDPVNDVAFLKIADVQGLIPVELGNSGSISIGQSVVAIGNALGQYKNTVTAGIVSGTGRSISASTGSGDSSQSSAPLTDLIQTDAAINPGNSGGPLVNAAGQVIGINTAIVQGANGIGFAIPINSTKGMLASLIRDGEAQRAFLGVSFVPITPSVARELELSVSRGAYVFVENGTAVLSGGPADKAGIRDRDIITKVGDRVVGVNGDLSNLVAEHSVGDQVEIALLRGGEEMTVRVTLGAFPVRQ